MNANNKDLTLPSVRCLLCVTLPSVRKIDQLRPRGPLCLVTGYARAFTDKQGKQLEAALAANRPPAELRYAVALVEMLRLGRKGLSEKAV